MRPLLTLLVALLLVLPSGAAPLRSLVFVQWSDLHAGHPDTHPGDWDRALDEGLALHPAGLLLSGDATDNKCPEGEFRRRVEAFLGGFAPRVRSSGLPVLVTLGNNDVPANYSSEPANLAPVLAAWRRHLGKAFYLDELGNGVHPRTLGGMTWISVNSLVFSPINPYEGRGLQARRTLEWLQRELRALPAGRPVVLLSHIPPTWDLYGHNPAWDPDELASLQGLLEERRAPVVILSGHFHRNELHALTLADGRAVPVLDAGALSGKYGSHPNWRTHGWTLEASGAPRQLAWQVRYPGHPEWNRRQEVEQPFQARTWTRFVQRLASDPAFYMQYMQDFWAHGPTWREDAGKPDVRRALLDEFLVRPRLGR